MAENYLQGKKYLWCLPAKKERDALPFASAYNLSIPIAQLLVERGFESREALDAYLFSSRERDVASPTKMKDLTKAADRIMKAITDKEKILVFGDYDVDGITATSLVLECLLPLGAQINFFLPNRARDGYGLSRRVVERAAANGYTVIVTVDNGISAYEAAEAAADAGMDLIITDHHQAHDKVPVAYAIVNPNQVDCSYPCKVLAGVGVAFKLMEYIYAQMQRPLPDKVYEFLTMGTVADVVPLIDENRFWVRYGLQLASRSSSLALSVLKQNANISKPTLTAHDIGYGLAPQLNALGRLEDPRQGVTFLLGNDKKHVESIGKTLFELNQARKNVERQIVQEVVATIEKGAIDLSREKCIIAANDRWPTGVIGLVASRLVGLYGKPTILLQITKDGLAKGSCRSIPEFNIFKALQATEDLLTSFGGHAQAAGLALPVEAVPQLKERLEAMIEQELTPFDLQQKLELDAPVSLGDVTKKFMTDMEHLQPFGHSNREPVFYCKGLVQLQPPRLLKDAHVKCQVFEGGVVKPLIFFNRPDLFDLLVVCEKEQRTFSCAVQIKENYWRDRVSIELLGLDIAEISE